VSAPAAPDLTGALVLVTGASSGIGAARLLPRTILRGMGAVHRRGAARR